MKTRDDRALVIGATRSIAVVLCLVWLAFVLSALTFAQTATRPVVINGVLKGRVELFNLEDGNGLNVRFCPANNDQNIFNGCALNWVQIVNRPGDNRYPRVDPPNNLGGYPPKGNPFYWDNWAGTDRGRYITNQGYYWMRDYPGTGNGVSFETWLVTTQGNNLQRLVCFNWGVSGTGGPSPNPGFVNGSSYNWNDAINKSQLPPYWTITDSPGNPVAIEISLESASAEAGHVQLVWFSPDAASIQGAVYRRTASTGWSMLGTAVSSGTDRLMFDDRTVTAGRYAYRLGYLSEGVERFTSETWMDVQAVSRFALEGVRPNPALGPVSVTFTLTSAQHALLEMYDISGRRVAVREVGSMGAGRHLVALNESRALRSGIYWVKLTQASEHATTKVVLE